MNKIIRPHTKHPIQYNNGYVVKSPLRYDLYDSFFSNDDKMEKSTTFSAPF